MGNPVPVKIETLVTNHYRHVFAYAFRLTGNAADAEDLAQQVFLRAQRARAQLKESEKADRWLLRIARNEFLRRVRKPASCTVHHDDIPAVPSGDPAVFEEVNHLLQKIPDEYRIVLLLYYFEDLTYREIADALDIPIGTVMSRLNRARAAMRSKYLKETDDPADESFSVVKRPCLLPKE